MNHDLNNLFFITSLNSLTEEQLLNLNDTIGPIVFTLASTPVNTEWNLKENNVVFQTSYFTGSLFYPFDYSGQGFAYGTVNVPPIDNYHVTPLTTSYNSAYSTVNVPPIDNYTSLNSAYSATTIPPIDNYTSNNTAYIVSLVARMPIYTNSNIGYNQEYGAYTTSLGF
jgi:hypothetical protein